MDREKAIDKIQKLLALSQGTTFQAEAEVALARAQRLMLEHNIALAEVEATVVGGDAWVTEDAWSGRRRPWESTFVEDIVQMFFFCRVLYSNGWGDDGPTRHVQFFGDRENVAMARYAYVYLCRTFRDLWLAHKRRTGASQRDCRSYYLGLTAGFSAKLRAERDALKRETASAGGALIRIADKLTKAFEEAYPKLRTASEPAPIRGGFDAFRSGRKDGEAINLRTPIAESASPRRLAHAT